MGVLFGREVWK